MASAVTPVVLAPKCEPLCWCRRWGGVHGCRVIRAGGDGVQLILGSPVHERL